MAWQTQPAHRRWLELEGDRLLDFARRHATPDGGFAWLDDQGLPRLDQLVELWITCRMTHVFALGQLLGRPGNRQFVDHGVRAMLGPLRDQVNGAHPMTLWGVSEVDRYAATSSYS